MLSVKEWEIDKCSLTLLEQEVPVMGHKMRDAGKTMGSMKYAVTALTLQEKIIVRWRVVGLVENCKYSHVTSRPPGKERTLVAWISAGIWVSSEIGHEQARRF